MAGRMVVQQTEVVTIAGHFCRVHSSLPPGSVGTAKILGDKMFSGT